ncbi:MAG: UvrD-helicase domain-containing protein [Acidobacteriota bacterium]
MSHEQHQAAYEVNAKLVDRSVFYQVACDPRRSVVVEACAGAGKTWMLVSRIIRSLLDGVPPQHILAITFTKKAAGEMRERLHAWLAMFASQTDEQRTHELIIRGLPAAAATEMAPRLGQLHQQWMTSGRSVEIHTIHGWFSRLIKVAPLDVLTELQLPPQMNLIEDQTELWPELWGRFLRKIDGSDARAVYARLVQSVGAFNLEGWLQTALSNRLEIELTQQAGLLEQSVETLAQWDSQWAPWTHPDQALADPQIVQRMWALAAVLGGAKGTIAKDAASAMTDALVQSDPTRRGDGLKAALLTAQGLPKKRLGDSEELVWAQDWLVAWLQARAQHQAHQTHRDMSELTRILFTEYAQIKAERGLADMVDLERGASTLLTDPVLAGWVQQRLDGQTQQLLMDEFQDTSPLQWQTLRSWLAAYAGAGGGRSGQQPMQVFLVGDPKQSIYRFRRADPRVFEAAKAFVVDGLDGDLLACDHTRRNAPGVILALNTCLHEAALAGEFPGFRTHTTESTEASDVRVLPTIERSALDKLPPREGWRDSLTEPRETEQASLKQLEAEQIAQAIEALTQHQAVPAGAIYVLARRRASLALVAQTLSLRGIPNIAPENAELADTPEVRDLLALMDGLVSPRHDLSLAQALKSPVFDMGDDDLLEVAALARADDLSWWDAIQQLGAQAPRWERVAQWLRSWQSAAQVLPPHDLLQKVVTEAGLRDSLARVLGVGRWEAAWSNVAALLSLSLELDSGRDATLYRWIRRVKRSLATLPPKAHADAVQLLTIHGAKGLEAEVVFLMDTDALPSKAETYGVLVDWPEGAAHPTRCAFLQSQANPPPSLQRLLEAEALAADREELNALYVAMTRAKTRLYISRVQPHYQVAKASWWTRLTGSHAVDAQTPWVPALADRQDEHPADAPRSPNPLTLEALPLLQPLPVAVPQPEASPLPIQILGQVVHKVLEWVTRMPDAQRTPARVERAICQAATQLTLAADWLPQARALVERLLHSSEVAPWLSAHGHLWAGNEVALHHRGQNLRLDRLVARANGGQTEWWVLDYKLNHQPQDLQEYVSQMHGYVQAVAAMQPGDPVYAAFITGAGRWLPLSDLTAAS